MTLYSRWELFDFLVSEACGSFHTSTDLNFYISHFINALVKMWKCILVIMLSLATFTFSCTDEELKATQSPENIEFFLIHSFDDVLNGSMSLVALLELLSISDKDRQLPVLFDVRSLRTANTRVISNCQPEMCEDKRKIHYSMRYFLSPQGSNTAGILYGCNVRTKGNAMFYFYDEHRWTFENPRYHRNFLKMSQKFEAEICNCNSTVTKFTQDCVIAKVARDSYKQNSLIIVIFILVFCAIFIRFLLAPSYQSFETNFS